MSRPTRREIALGVLELSGKIPEPQLAKSLAKYLVSERRSNELEAIMRDVAFLRAQDGVTEVNLTSSFPLSAKVKKQLLDLLDSSKTVVNETIDKNVIGGVRLETSEQLLDLTVRGRLQKLKQGVNSK